MPFIHRRTEKVSPGTLQEVNKALERYVAELEATNLSKVSKQNYERYADCFVRWLRDDFMPGSRV